MSFETLKKLVGQQAVVVIDMYLDQNDPALQTWLFPESYDTPKTYPAGYNAATPKKLYRFSNQQLGPGAGVHFPILGSWNITPPIIKDGIALFAGLSFTIKDINTNDVYELPQEYEDNPPARRVYGSFLAKLFARNYFHNRTVIFREGFDPLNFDLANFQSQTFVIDKVQGPSYNGRATYACLDPLVWTEESKAKAPRKNVGELVADIDAVVTTLELTTTNPGEYAPSGLLFIDSEILEFTVNTDVPPVINMTVTRGQWGTTAADHTLGALGQECFFAINENVTDIILRLFENFTSITQDLINIAQFTDAKQTTLSLHNYTGVITKPTGVGETITKLLYLAQSQIFSDTVEGLISFVHIDEYASPSYILDALIDILPGTLQTRFLESNQVTRQSIDWARLDSSNKDIENYSSGYIFIDDLKEAPQVYGEASEGEDIVTDWLNESAEATSLATGIVQKIVNKRSKMPIKVDFTVDLEHISSISDGFWLADFIQIINAPLITGPDLVPIGLNMQVTSFKALQNNTYNITGVVLSQVAQDFDHVIDTDFTNLLLTDEAPPIVGRATIVFIAEGVTIGSASTAIAALITGLYPDGLILRNRGRIFGMGGIGGNGTNLVGEPGQNGFNGGNALEVQAITTIDNGNGGLIYGGGGGGSGSGTIFVSGPNVEVGGSGGGGGQSALDSAGGLGALGADRNGIDGGFGNQENPGIGGSVSPFINIAGDGGQWGEDGINAPPAIGGLTGMSIIETGVGDFTIIDGNNEFQLKPIPPLI